MRRVTPTEAVQHFRKVCDHAAEEQERFLECLLARNAHTEFGERYGFGEIRGHSQYCRAVPLSEFSDYEESFSRILRGERNILTVDSPVFCTLSSGTTGDSKYIPLCAEDTEKQYLYADNANPGIIRECLPQYSEQELFGCIFHVSEFFYSDQTNGIMNGVRTGVSFCAERREGIFDLSRFSAPEEVLFPDCLEDMLYPKIRFALDREDVTAIHGIFVHRLVGLMEYIIRSWDALLSDIANGTVSDCFPVSDKWKEYVRRMLPPNPRRAEQLAALDPATLREGMLRKLWKNIRYIRIASGPQFGLHHEKLKVLAGDIPLHGFMYASSESLFGIPPRLGVTGEYALLPDVCYFEFIPEEQTTDPKDFLTIREIRQGNRYELVVTTLSGLYRYRIGDVVEVAGFLGEAPVVRISYRKDMVISMLDERMNTMQMENAVHLFAERTGIRVNNYCVTGDAEETMPRYIMYLDTDRGLPPDARAVMDQCLRESCMGYNGIRTMNELAEVEVFRVRKGAFSEYEQFRHTQGKRMEQSKLVRVLNRDDQIAFFSSEREND